jgi:transposase-like protein
MMSRPSSPMPNPVETTHVVGIDIGMESCTMSCLTMDKRQAIKSTPFANSVQGFAWLFERLCAGYLEYPFVNAASFEEFQVAIDIEASGLRTSPGRRVSLWYTEDHSTYLHEEGIMNCPHCASTVTKERTKRTSLGYRTFCCSDCKRIFNERTGTAFNFLEYPTDIVLLVVVWRLRYKLSLRDLAEMFLERGFAFTHEAVRDWEARFAPLLADQLRAKRRGQRGAVVVR